MQINKTTIAAFFALTLTQLLAQTGSNVTGQYKKRTGTSSLEFKLVAGKMHTLICNQRFSVISICNDKCSDYILHETFYSDQEDGVEGGKFEATVTASSKNEPNKELWKIQSTGDEGNPWYDFYKVIQHGCCGAENTMTYFSLRSGKKVYSASSDDENALLKIEVPNTHTKRYVAFSYFYSKSGTPVGRLQFGDGEFVQQMVAIKQPSYDRPPDVSLRMTGKPDSQYAQLWSGNGDRSSKAVSGVTVVLKFDSAEILIPIENDRLVVQKAKTPKGYTINE
jgi:hypothetical protein